MTVLGLALAVLDGPVVAADRPVLERVLAESAVQRTPVPAEASYARDLALAFGRALTELFARGAEMLRIPRGVFIGLLVTLALVLLVLLARAVVRWWRGRRPEKKAEGAVAVAGVPAVDPEWDAAAWRAELDRCLAEGRVADGLRAAWWWLARSLAGAQVEPDWTSRDLLARSGRHDLRDLMRGLDTLIYGPERPGVDDLRRLVGRLEASLP